MNKSDLDIINKEVDTTFMTYMATAQSTMGKTFADAVHQKMIGNDKLSEQIKNSTNFNLQKYKSIVCLPAIGMNSTSPLLVYL